MKNVAILLIVHLIFALLQTSFFSVLFGNYFNPNLMFALCLVFLLSENGRKNAAGTLDSLEGETSQAYMSALIGGVLIDISTANILGITSLYMCIVVFLLTLLKKFFLKGSLSVLLASIPFIYLYKLLVGRIFIFNFDLVLGTICTLILGFIFYFFYKHFKYDQPIL